MKILFPNKFVFINIKLWIRDHRSDLWGSTALRAICRNGGDCVEVSHTGSDRVVRKDQDSDGGRVQLCKRTTALRGAIHVIAGSGWSARIPGDIHRMLDRCAGAAKGNCHAGIGSVAGDLQASAGGASSLRSKCCSERRGLPGRQRERQRKAALAESSACSSYFADSYRNT